MNEEKIDANWLIRDILENYPETIPVFERHFWRRMLHVSGGKT